MNKSARDKIFKSWSGVSEVALIKEVATKGEHVDLCIEYWATKRKMPLDEYKLFFHDVVQTYVYRLLTERLVCKAENVLRNVQRNVSCFYYQFACECEDAELRELVLEHLRRKEPQSFGHDMQELKFYWELLLELQQSPDLLQHFKAELRRINLENVLNRDEAFRKQLMVELYFEKHNPAVLSRLNKFVVWDYLVRKQNWQHLVRWCAYRHLRSAALTSDSTELDMKYCQWHIEAEMFEYALKAVENPNEVLRNSFAKEGYFFQDEHQNVIAVVRRVVTTQSFTRNQMTLSKLPLGKWLLERGLHMLLLRDFVSTRELQEMAEVCPPSQREMLELIAVVKDSNIQEREGFEKVARAVKIYLESQGVDFETTQPLATFYEFLCNEPSKSALNCFLQSSALKRIPYLCALAQRLDSVANPSSETVPTPYDMLRKFHNLDFKQIICSESNDIASFSNASICQKYARKFNLNFLHYLNQQRSCFAVYYLLTEYLQKYGQLTRTQLFSATETVTELALQHADNLDLVTHCVAFSEMLGFDTQNLRNLLKLRRQLPSQTVSISNFSKLIDSVEAVLVARMDQERAHFPLADYQALMRMAACNQHKKWPVLIMQRLARADDWWQLLVLVQYFEVPLKQLQRLAQNFATRTVGEHLLRALSYEPTIAVLERMVKRTHSSLPRQQKQARKNDNQVALSSSTSTITSSVSSCNDNAFFKTSRSTQLRFLMDSSGNLDLFAIILLSTNSMLEERIDSATQFLELMQDVHSYATSVNLMKNSMKFQLPILSLLAATVSPLNLDWNWVMWLAVATDQWQEVQSLCLRNVEELVWTLIENCVRNDNVGTLHRSICIFYETNPLKYFTRFLHETSDQRNFSDDVINDLRVYLLSWSNNKVAVPHCAVLSRDSLMSRSMQLLLVHLQTRFSSALDQSKLLQCICKSGISDISDLLDFCLLNEVFGILQSSECNKSSLNFEQLLKSRGTEYEQLIDTLMASKEYDLAIRLATVLHMPISDKVYTKWVAGVHNSSLHGISFQQYEDEIRTYSLPPELLVNFYLYAGNCLEEPCSRKYLLLKRALTVIKLNHLFPNESFDRDQIEYDMVLCYLQLSGGEQLEKADLYHSEYFEQIMLKERCVLYKSFLELKELAGIDDLTISRKVPLTATMKPRLEELLNRLLDEGDIVEALRVQELFEYRPVDLRFVVFCMALAEGVTTIFSLSSEERQLLREVEKSAFSKFNKRTLGTLRSSGQSSPFKQSNDLSDSCSTLEFEEIPSKEKRETLETIQGIVSRLKNGVNIGTRILKSYRAAMYLDKEYLDILRTKDVMVLLRSVAEDSCMYKLLVVSDITTSTQMTPSEIANLLAFEITTAIVRPRFYIFTADQQAKNTFKNAHLWGYNIDRDFHLLLELAPQTTILGNCLLEYCTALKTYRRFQDGKHFEHTIVFEKLSDIIATYGLPAAASLQASGITASHAANATTPPQVLSHKKQNIICVELLIKAHQCFVHECSMEGIANVLNRAKALHSTLVNAKSWSLVVRMLIGIARYREMFYCFDALIEHEQFEALLGQFDVEKTIVLRQAIVGYLREYCPANERELLKLAALHFLMYKELAEMWEQDAQTLVSRALTTALVGTAQLVEQISTINLSGVGGVTKTFIPKLLSSSELLNLLQHTMENYTHATENYLLDNKLLLAQRSASQAELIAMQIDLASKALDKTITNPHLCVCVLNVQTRDEFRELINAELRVPQAIILSRATGYDINWAEVLLSQFVILTKVSFLGEYLMHFPLSDNIIDNIVKGFQHYAQTHKTSAEMEEHLAQIVGFVKSVTLKYKLASILNIKSTVLSLISEQSVFYLKDTNYGRTESQNLPDV